VRLDHIVPLNYFIDRTKLIDPSFDLTEEPFDFSICLWVFNRCRDMPDVVKSKELSEFMVGMLGHELKRIAYRCQSGSRGEYRIPGIPG